MLRDNSLKNKSNRLLWLLLAGAFIIRIVYLYLYQTLPDWDQLTVDNYYHHHWAQSIANGNLLGDTTYFRAPFYIYILSGLYYLAGFSLWVGRLFGLVVGLATIFMTYRLGQRLYSTKVGLWAAALYAFMPTSIYFESELLLDPLFTLLCLIAIDSFFKWTDSKLPIDLLCCGIMFGLAAITRPTILVFIPIIFWYTFKISKEIKPLKAIAVLTLGLILIIGPVFARNLIVADDPVLISSQGGINFYIGNNETADGITAAMPAPLGHNWRLEDTRYLAEKELNQTLSPGEQSSFWMSKGVEWITNNPSAFVSLYFKKLYLFFSPDEFSNNRSIGAFYSKIWILRYNRLGFGLIVPFAMLGLLWTSKKKTEFKLVLWFVVSISLVTALFFINSRFRVPIVPFLTIFAAAGSFEILRRAGQSTRLLMPTMPIVALIALGLNLSLVALPINASNQDLLSKGLKHLNRGEYREALYYLSSAEKINNQFPTTNLNIGICYFRLGAADSAKYYFEQEKLYHPDRPKSYTNLASLSLVNEQFESALNEINQALTLRPYDQIAQIIRLRTINNLSVPTDSLYKIALEAVRMTRNDLYVYNSVLYHFMSRNNFQIADQFISETGQPIKPPIETDNTIFDASSRYSDEPYKLELSEWHFNLGFIYGNLGRLEESITHSQLSIKFNPEHTRAYQNLITGLESIGKYPQADSLRLLLQNQSH